MTPTDPTSLADVHLWSAIRQHSTDTQSPPVRLVLLAYEDGTVVELHADGTRDDWSGEWPGGFPAAAGWSFTAGRAAYNGRVFRVAGLRWRMLRTLAAGQGQPVSDRSIRLRVWGDARTEDGRLRDVACQLRATLRAALDLAEEVDPVERVEGGYRLTLR